MNYIKKTWNAVDYQKNYSFVPMYGEDMLGMLDVKEGERILDIGCGNGTLTKKIKDLGARVVGIDQSEEMIELAKSNFKEIEFHQMNAETLNFKSEFDGIFSNAVFHWIKDQDALLTGIADSLVTGGRLVCEFGGYGCAESVHRELKKAFEKRGLVYHKTFYFPTIGEYAPKMESHGLKVQTALLFDRPTRVNGGEEGLKNWILMFIIQSFEGIEASLRDEIIAEAEKNLRDVLYKDGDWYIDYVRIRIKAVKEEM